MRNLLTYSNNWKAYIGIFIRFSYKLVLTGGLFLAFFASAQIQEVKRTEQVKIPFELERGRIYVNTFVNNRGPFRFMVDTGASGTGRVDTKLVSELGLTVTGETTHSDGINTATIKTVSLNALKIGDLTQHKVEVLSRNYNSTPPPRAKFLWGIIGRDFFSDYLLTIDYAKSELIMSKDSLNKSEPSVMRYETPFMLPLRIGQYEAVGYLDTGSSLEMHLPLEWANRLKIQSLKDAGEGRKANTVIKLFSATLPITTEIGGNKIANIKAHFSEPAPRINIGSALLANNKCVVAIDQRKQLVKIKCATN